MWLYKNIDPAIAGPAGPVPMPLKAEISTCRAKGYSAMHTHPQCIANFTQHKFVNIELVS